MEIPINRDALIKLYMKAKPKDASLIAMLDPEYCAKTRDPDGYSLFPFSLPINRSTAELIKIAGCELSWLLPRNSDLMMRAIGLEGFLIKPACDKRIKYMLDVLTGIAPLYPNEISLIAHFTSCIIWLESSDHQFIGSAAFHEVPHCTFFSDAAMFSLPPEILVPKEFSSYAILENLYHEALHHQMHSYASLATEGYLCEGQSSTSFISMDWRDRTFTLIEALHALHVYSLVTPMRYKYKTFLEDKGINVQPDDWINVAINEGMKMCSDLYDAIEKQKNYLKEPWSSLPTEWMSAYMNSKQEVGTSNAVL